MQCGLWKQIKQDQTSGDIHISWILNHELEGGTQSQSRLIFILQIIFESKNQVKIVVE